MKKNRTISLGKPFVGKEEIAAVAEVLRSGWYAHGAKNEEFENMFAEYTGTRYAVSVNSCTSALFLSLLALNIKGEVILPSFTFVATANAIVTAGAVPVFADVDYETGNILPESIEEAVTPRTEAVICVHFAGQSCQMDKIKKICTKHKLALIEDSAECIGGEFEGKRTGGFGVTGCFSFFPTKNLTTGEGGMITLNDPTIYAKIRALLAHGISKDTLGRKRTGKPWQRSAQYAGYNFRMSNILAAMGVEQFKKLEKMNQMRTERAGFLDNALKNIGFLKIPKVDRGVRHVYQMYTIKIINGERDNFLKYLRENRIEASVHFDPPVHLQDFYINKKYRSTSLSNTEKLSRDIVTLPFYPHMPYSDLNFMIDKIKKYSSKK